LSRANDLTRLVQKTPGQAYLWLAVAIFGSFSAIAFMYIERRFFFGDLEPIGIQLGGAGMVVNLYNKSNNYTFSYCATYDVILALKKGRIKAFPAAEVK
jgi:hypothetical protein